MTVFEARQKNLCRICLHPVVMLAPARVFDRYQDLDWPARVTFNYGKEFAHTECFEKTRESTPEAATARNAGKSGSVDLFA